MSGRGATRPRPVEVAPDATRLLRRADYDRHLEELQRELVKLQEWVVQKGLRVCVVFEGRDAAGKGGTIKRIVDRTTRGLVRSTMRLMVPPFPAASRPSKRTQMRKSVWTTHSCSLTSSRCSLARWCS